MNNISFSAVSLIAVSLIFFSFIWLPISAIEELVSLMFYWLSVFIIYCSKLTGKCVSLVSKKMCFKDLTLQFMLRQALRALQTEFFWESPVDSIYPRNSYTPGMWSVISLVNTFIFWFPSKQMPTRISRSCSISIETSSSDGIVLSSKSASKIEEVFDLFNSLTTLFICCLITLIT